MGNAACAPNPLATVGHDGSKIEGRTDLGACLVWFMAAAYRRVSDDARPAGKPASKQPALASASYFYCSILFHSGKAVIKISFDTRKLRWTRSEGREL